MYLGPLQINAIFYFPCVYNSLRLQGAYLGLFVLCCLYLCAVKEKNVRKLGQFVVAALFFHRAFCLQQVSGPLRGQPSLSLSGRGSCPKISSRPCPAYRCPSYRFHATHLTPLARLIKTATPTRS